MFFVAPTYRSRDLDLQTADSLEDAIAVIEYLRAVPFVDRQSIVVGGCSGGGDLALHVASRTGVCAVVAEEPASVVMSGVFNNSTPKQGERYTPEDGFFLMADGRRYYTADLQERFRAKLEKLDAPILIVQGEVGDGPIHVEGPGRNRFNAEVLIPDCGRRQATADIFVMRADGSDGRRLTDDAAEEGTVAFAWK